ncbi:MAG: class I SAM-dependent methyltransferase [Desulfobacteraceae bacterium]|nr:class I SAM-dependent methyltransferase [Desulfobacteraceae bacterium]
MITIDFNRLPIKKNARILDIGCGEGRHTIKACQENHTICTGADFGFENLITTKGKLKFHDEINDLSCKDWNLSCMDVTSLPFKDNCFDVVICSEVLEHIIDDAKAFSELIRIVKPGKTLAVSVPRFIPEKICWLLSDDYFNANMGHVRIYKKKDLIQNLEQLGVRHFATHYAHSIHSPFWWLKCLVGPNREDVGIVNLYHKFLVWDLMKQPKITRFFDKLFNPVLGKSLVLYFTKH